MSPNLQTTIRYPVRFAHRGLLTGRPVEIQLKPAPPDTGVIFNGDIPARLDRAFVLRHSVGLRCGRRRILSVEHLLATCYGLGIDNLEVKVTGPEVPFGDGSALPFVRILQAAGIKTSRKTRRVQSLHGPVIAHAGDAFVCALPLPGAGRAAALNLNYLIRFPEPVAGEQFYQSWLTPTEFVSELSPARTFGYRQSVPTWLRPLARPGGNLILPAHPRMTGEQVRHKVLDLIGDLALLGRRLRAAVFAYKSGHRLNQQLVKQLEEQWT